MTLSIADIDRWDAAAISSVSQLSAQRAEAAAHASGALGRLRAFESWSGQGSAAALEHTRARAADLGTHVTQARAVADAARVAANEVQQVKTQLTAIRSSAASYGIAIDAASSRVIPPALADNLPAASRRMIQTLARNTQAAIDQLLKGADKADELLSKAVQPLEGKKVELVEKSKEFDKTKKKQKDWGSRKESPKGDGADGKDKPNKKPVITVFNKDVSGKASVYSKEVKGEHTFDNGAKVEGSAGVDVLSAGAGANAKVTSNGISAGANANATLVSGEAKGSANWGGASAEGEARAAVEATADVNASLGTNGLKVEGEAFAGAKLTGDASVDAGGVGVGAHGELHAGIGISGDVDAGIEDGKVKVGGSFGAALGLGGKMGFDVEIDPGKVTNTVRDGVKNVGKWLGF